MLHDLGASLGRKGCTHTTRKHGTHRDSSPGCPTGPSSPRFSRCCDRSLAISGVELALHTSASSVGSEFRAPWRPRGGCRASHAPPVLAMAMCAAASCGWPRPPLPARTKVAQAGVFQHHRTSKIITGLLRDINPPYLD